MKSIHNKQSMCKILLIFECVCVCVPLLNLLHTQRFSLSLSIYLSISIYLFFLLMGHDSNKKQHQQHKMPPYSIESTYVHILWQFNSNFQTKHCVYAIIITIYWYWSTRIFEHFRNFRKSFSWEFKEFCHLLISQNNFGNFWIFCT